VKLTLYQQYIKITAVRKFLIKQKNEDKKLFGRKRRVDCMPSLIQALIYSFYPRYNVILTFANDELGGYAVTYTEGESTQILKIYIDEDLRGNGGAIGLLNEIERFARKKGNIGLASFVYDDDKRAFSLLNKFGFKSNNTYKWLGESGTIMLKPFYDMYPKIIAEEASDKSFFKRIREKINNFWK